MVGVLIANIIVLGVITVTTSIYLVTKDGQDDKLNSIMAVCLAATLLVLFPIFMLSIHYDQPISIADKYIEYKSIDPSNEGYYAIGKDGIYKITPEEWWKLDVPIIAETK